MERIQLGGREVAGFGLGSGAPSKPIGKYGGFVVGAGLTALAGIIASFFGEGSAPENRIMNAEPILILTALGGGIAGAIVAPSRSG